MKPLSRGEAREPVGRLPAQWGRGFGYCRSLFKGGRPTDRQRKLLRVTLRAWLTHPSELFATLLFAGFMLLSFVVLLLGHPQGFKSLGYSFLYGFAWFLWMGYVVYFLSPSFRLMQFLRSFGPWIAVMLSYNLLRTLIPAVNSTRNDLMFREMEFSLWGKGSAYWTQSLFGHPYWTDFFCLVYLSLFVWMFGFLLYYAFREGRLYQRLMLGLIMIYTGGFIGYLIYPAEGPRYAFPNEWNWLNGGTLFWITNEIVGHFGARLDVFPSLHAAIAVYLLFWQAEHHRI